MIIGLSHLTFIVKDLARSARFFEAVFEAEETYSSGDKTFSLSREKYFLLAGLWVCLMEGDPLSQRTYNHVAFQIPIDELEGFAARVRQAGGEVLPGRPRTGGEGQSLYFYDLDNHLFELHAGTLTERLAHYSSS